MTAVTLNIQGRLFQEKGTTLREEDAGSYEIVRLGVLLRDRQNKVRAFIVNNPREHSNWIVTAGEVSEGIRYSFGMCDIERKWLGMDTLSYSAQDAVAGQAILDLGLR